jgi:hypothetical protein
MEKDKMATKTETFFLESSEDALKFAKSCAEENITAELLPVEDHDGRKYYPVKVTFDPASLKKK